MGIRTPAIAFHLDGPLEAVATFSLEDGRVTHAYVVRNPNKLRAMEETVVLTRS